MECNLALILWGTVTDCEASPLRENVLLESASSTLFCAMQVPLQANKPI